MERGVRRRAVGSRGRGACDAVGYDVGGGLIASRGRVFEYSEAGDLYTETRRVFVGSWMLRVRRVGALRVKVGSHSPGALHADSEAWVHGAEMMLAR